MAVEPAEITLVCDACGARRLVNANGLVGHRPLLEWWIVERAQRCSACVLPLPDPSEDEDGKARADAPATARRAAWAARPRSGTSRYRLLLWIARRASTDEEAQQALQMNPSTERPRRVELVEGGWIRASGETRAGASGQDAIVWELSERGRREMLEIEEQHRRAG